MNFTLSAHQASTKAPAIVRSDMRTPLPPITHQPLTSGLHERRQAALQCPPLASGHRDPLNDFPPLTESEKRDLCNRLYQQGFSIEYLEHRFGMSRAPA